MIQLKNYLSIVIPCKNEAENIHNLLRSLNFQRGVEGMKVYVADADSTDNTAGIVTACAMRYRNLDIELIKGGMPAYGRNRGADAASTRFVAFIDADIVLPDKELLIKSIGKMSLSDLDMVTTNIRCISNNWKASLFYFGSSICQKISSAFFKPLATGMFMMVRTRAFNELGKFDEDIQFAEDYHLSRRVPRNRFRIINNSHVGTTDRRVRRMGFFKVVWLALVAFLKSGDELQYRKDVGYWDHLKKD